MTKIKTGRPSLYSDTDYKRRLMVVRCDDAEWDNIKQWHPSDTRSRAVKIMEIMSDA